MTCLHLQILPNRNIGVQHIRYTNGYIPKLQIHQHSLFTRKVFSRHNLSAQVFFSVSSVSSLSSHHLHLQVIFIWIWIITRYVSSLLNLDHHSIWIIITGSGSSSLDLDHHSIWIIITGSGSSLNLDHLWSIISAGSSILNLHRCFLMILLVTRISTEPALFHAGFRPNHHVGLP